MNKVYNSKKFIKKKKTIKKIRRIVFFVFLVTILSGVFFWMRHPITNINNVKVVNSSFSRSDQIQARISAILDEKILYLIPKSNAILLPRNEVENSLKENFPMIEKVNFDLDSLNDLEVQVYEYDPKIIVSINASSSEMDNQDEKRYFVNKEGLVFMEEPLIHSFDDLLILKIEKNTLEIREKIIEPDLLLNIIGFYQSIKDLSIDIDYIEYKGQNTYYIYTNMGFEILISSEDDLDVSFSNIKTIIENDALEEENLEQIDYIDLRFGNKVFYKLKSLE